MDQSVFAPMISFQEELLRTLPSATAPSALRIAREGEAVPVPGADLVPQIAQKAFALRAQVEEALARLSADDQNTIQQIVAAATAPLPPIDMTVVAQLEATSGQPAPGAAPPESPPPPAPPPPQPRKRGARPPKASGG